MRVPAPLPVSPFVLAMLCAHADDVVWRGDRVIREPVTIKQQTLRIEPGSRIAFKGEGRIRVEDGDLVATRALFAARSTLTNDFRIAVQNGRLMVGFCMFRGLKSYRAGGVNSHFIDGFLYNQFGNEARIEDCKLIDCSAMMLLNASHVEISRNLAIRCDNAFSLLNCTECRLDANEFFAAPSGLKLNGVGLSEVFKNRFTDCTVGIFLCGCKENRFAGNAFFGGGEGLKLWWLGKSNVFVGNRFEAMGSPIAKNEEIDATNVFRGNDIDGL